jgi:hypothetical protein
LLNLSLWHDIYVEQNEPGVVADVVGERMAASAGQGLKVRG